MRLECSPTDAALEAGVALRPLHGEPDEMLALQRVIEDAPRYADLTTGAPPGSADAQSLYTILPDGKTYDDKFVLGIHRDEAMVGCIDLIRGYPDPDTAHIGLLLIGEGQEGRGFGRAAYAGLEDLVRSWESCTRLRLGVVRSNDRALRFWSALGFVPTGEVKPYRYGSIVSEVVLYAKVLDLVR